MVGVRYVALAIFLLLPICGCEEFRRGGKPKNYLQVKVIDFSPLVTTEIAGRACIQQAYSVVEDEEGKRYHVIGKVGPVGDTFKMDVSLMKEIGS